MSQDRPAMPTCLLMSLDAVVVAGIGGGWIWSPHLTVGGSPPFAAILPLAPVDFAIAPLAEWRLLAEGGPAHPGDFFLRALVPFFDR